MRLRTLAGVNVEPCATAPEAPTRPIPSYVHHRARMTEGQRAAWERWWPGLGHEVTDIVEGREPYDPPAWFGRDAPLVLEIGSGMGESTAALAAATPEVDHLAVEVFEPGLAQLLMRVGDLGASNVALLRGDGVALLRERVPPESLHGVRIFFPDPWPKRRHRKRRLVQPAVVALVASRLRPAGTLHLSTDWADYADQMIAVCSAERLLVNTAREQPDGWTSRPEWRPVTKFEERAGREGREVRDLIFQRRTGGPAPDHVP